MHPSGGNINVYLRWRGLVSDDQPLYAMQSRALQSPEREYESLVAMAYDYARMIDSKCPDGSCQLVGWSMGALIAHAVACELETRGRKVNVVSMIDPPPIRQPREADSAVRDLAFALTSAIYDLVPSCSVPVAKIFADLRKMGSKQMSTVELLSFCEDRGISRGIVAAEDFDVLVRLRLVHFGLIRDYNPPVCGAPLKLWWSDEQKIRLDWRQHTAATVQENNLGGTHFSVMKSPLVEQIVADLLTTH
jgi:thioesterase domain-containing protein